MKLLIIEDEETAAAHLVSMLEAFIEQPNILGIIDNVEEAVDLLATRPAIDLIFMDIYLSDGISFEIFRNLTVDTPVIFTTAYDQYAIRAFDVNSIDYLLKPIRTEQLQKALEKFHRLEKRDTVIFDERVLEKLTGLLESQVNYKRNFLVPYKDRLLPVAAEDFAWFGIRNGVVRGVTFDKKYLLMEESLDDLAGMLDPRQFYRANRQFLVSRKTIREVEYYFNGRLILRLTPPPDEQVLISKAKAGGFREWLVS